MTAQNTWNLVKRRYRLPAKVQMNFELGFPTYHIGKCRCIVNTVCDIKTKKIFLAQKGIVLSDTIPLGWFTSPVFIPWDKVLNMAVSTDDPGTPELRPGSDEQAAGPGYCTLRLNDPVEMTIDIPWTEAFRDYMKENGVSGG